MGTVLALIAKLYQVETTARKSGIRGDDLRVLRQTASVPILKELRLLVEKRKAGQRGDATVLNGFLADAESHLQLIWSKPRQAHTTWFFETFVLRPFLPRYKPFREEFRWLFNSITTRFVGRFRINACALLCRVPRPIKSSPSAHTLPSDGDAP
jgi:hypothetical protein